MRFKSYLALFLFAIAAIPVDMALASNNFPDCCTCKNWLEIGPYSRPDGEQRCIATHEVFSDEFVKWIPKDNGTCLWCDGANIDCSQCSSRKRKPHLTAGKNPPAGSGANTGAAPAANTVTIEDRTYTTNPNDNSGACHAGMWSRWIYSQTKGCPSGWVDGGIWKGQYICWKCPDGYNNRKNVAGCCNSPK